MATPGSVELDEDILAIVEDDLIKLLRDQNEDASILRSRNFLAPEGWLQFASEVVLDERANGFGSGVDILGKRVLELLGDILDNECGPLELLKVHSLGVLVEAVGVNPGKVDLALVLLGDGLEGLDNLLLALEERINEDIGQRKSGLGVSLVGIAVNLVQERNSIGLDPRAESLLVNVGDIARVINTGIVERPVDNDCRLGDASGLSDSGINGMAEQVVITVSLSVL